MKRYLLFILIFSSMTTRFLWGADKYSTADEFLKNKDFEQAAANYLKIITESGGIEKSRDIKALTGGFISNFMLENYKDSFAMAKQVLKVDTYNSCAIFYAGQNLEAMGKTDLARNIYKYYQVLPESAPYKRFSEVKYYTSTQLDLVKKIESAIDREQRLTYTPPITNRIVVMYFVNEGLDDTLDPVGKGIADLLIRDLETYDEIDVVERRELEILLTKFQLTRHQLVEDKIIKRLASILQARYLLGGRYNVNVGLNSVFDVFLIDMLDQSVVEEFQSVASDQDFEFIRRDLLHNTLSHLEISQPSDTYDAIDNNSTENYNAFLAYCNGLDEFDHKNYEVSRDYFTQAIALDSNFLLAYEQESFVDAFVQILQNTFANNHFVIMEQKYAYFLRHQQDRIPILQDRIRTMSNILDLGYLPGNESRAGKEAYIIPEIPEIRELGEPPQPPGN